jgi:pyrimidine-nucleoside phosphorylase
MHVPSILERKRDGGALTRGEIEQVIRDFTDGTLPDYQMSALAMAICIRGMSAEETGALTGAMLNSGSRLRWPEGAPLRVDKHSTGGVGDKSSLVLAPLLACCGVWVPMISGRGLGFTGGTLDKLESIPGFRVGLSEEELYRTVEKVGCAMIGQTANICPADKKLYALRDVTGTVPSIPLIVASIMSKKLAEGLDRLVLDVKYGSGAFMQTKPQAQELADAMVAAGKALGVATVAQLHPMSEPCGESAGNALEVAECVRCLQGRGPADLEDLVLELAAGVVNTPREELAGCLRDGRAWARFQEMVAAQGGDAESLERIESLHAAPVVREILAPASGVLTQLDARAMGQACVRLGAGRSKASDLVDAAVGFDRILKCGCEVQVGQPLCRVHARTEQDAQEAARMLLMATAIS